MLGAVGVRQWVAASLLLLALLGLVLLGGRSAQPLPAGPPRTATPVAPPVDRPQAPGPVPGLPAAPSLVDAGPAPTTTIAVLRWSAAGIELVRAVDKPALPWKEAPETGGARFVIEDPRTGARLGEGPCARPRLCACPRARDHLRGDVVVRHEAVVRLKLPRLAAQERVRIEAPGPEGWEALGSFELERGS